MSRDTMFTALSRSLRIAFTTAAAIGLLSSEACNRTSNSSGAVASTDDGSVMDAERGTGATRNDRLAATPKFPFAHEVRVYVSAVNCEMNADDAARINALAQTPGLAVEVVFAGISGNDTSVVKSAQHDLELRVPVRQLQKDELEQYKSIGGAMLPMALIVKGRQLKTVVSGESMPRTLSIVEASLTSTAVPNHHQLPER